MFPLLKAKSLKSTLSRGKGGQKPRNHSQNRQKMGAKQGSLKLINKNLVNILDDKVTHNAPFEIKFLIYIKIFVD